MDKLGLSKKMYYVQRTRWNKGLAAVLPEAYKKFWKEWKARPSAVHYIEEKGKYKRNEETEEVLPVQNVPLPVMHTKEMHEGLWGGEYIIRGFKKKGKFKRRVPHFWIPTLKRSVVYSEVLDSYMKVVITYRLIILIHENYGFDHYLLKTPACDIRSLLGLRLKRKILLALADKTLYPDDPQKREEVYTKYKQYLSAILNVEMKKEIRERKKTILISKHNIDNYEYTREEIEWYGLSYEEACKKISLLMKKTTQPLKIQYKSELIAKLKENKIKEAENVDVISPAETDPSWISKINPFSKSPKRD